jgi:hypothetical protein
MGVQVSPWSLRLQAGRCPADPHKVSMSGSIPEPATLSGRASARLRFIPSANQVRLLGPGLLRPSTQTRKSGHLERVVTLWVRLPPRLLAQLIAPIRCLGVAALHAALSRQRYGIDTRRHRFYGPVVQWPRRPFHMRETMVRVHAGSLIEKGLLVQLGRRRLRKSVIGVRLPGGPLQHGPMVQWGRFQPGVLAIRVQLPVGPL